VNSHEAKEILALYRPGTADAKDPAFAGALELAMRDPELGRWLEDHCAAYITLRGKFLRIPVPAGLKEQILAEHKVHAPIIFWRRPSVLLAAAAAIALMLAVTPLLLHKTNTVNYFAAYENWTAKKALLAYPMDKETDDLEKIREFLAQKNAPADYVLPAGIQNAKTVGCAILNWQGHRVSMLCFHSGGQLGPGEKSDLWLFVIDHAAVPGAPSTDAPVPARVNSQLTAASWTQGNRTYILAGRGNEEFLQKYF
jgi:hypothetical protein